MGENASCNTIVFCWQGGGGNKTPSTEMYMIKWMLKSMWQKSTPSVTFKKYNGILMESF